MVARHAGAKAIELALGFAVWGTHVKRDGVIMRDCQCWKVTMAEIVVRLLASIGD
jgi:hypothetical protein